MRGIFIKQYRISYARLHFLSREGLKFVTREYIMKFDLFEEARQFRANLSAVLACPI